MWLGGIILFVQNSAEGLDCFPQPIQKCPFFFPRARKLQDAQPFNFTWCVAGWGHILKKTLALGHSLET